MGLLVGRNIVVFCLKMPTIWIISYYGLNSVPPKFIGWRFNPMYLEIGPLRRLLRLGKVITWDPTPRGLLSLKQVEEISETSLSALSKALPTHFSGLCIKERPREDIGKRLPSASQEVRLHWTWRIRRYLAQLILYLLSLNYEKINFCNSVYLFIFTIFQIEFIVVILVNKIMQVLDAQFYNTSPGHCTVCSQYKSPSKASFPTKPSSISLPTYLLAITTLSFSSIFLLNFFTLPLSLTHDTSDCYLSMCLVIILLVSSVFFH